MNMMPDPLEEEEEDFQVLPLRWTMPEDLKTLYANHFLITYSGTEFYLVFGELVPPFIADEANLADLPDFVEIKPVVRLAISAEAMEKIADAINRNLGKNIKRSGTFGDKA